MSTSTFPFDSTPAPAPRSYKILVAVAFDSTSDAALLQGMSLAARDPDAELHVVHAVAAEGASPSMSAFELKELPERLRERVEIAWEQTRELEVIAHVRPGPAAETILQTAIDVGADVIVVGSHRRAGLSKLMLGSVAERVLRDAHCPVLIALTKDYAGTVASPSIEPPCADCLTVREQTANARFWCERHSKRYVQPHVYVPRDAGRSSILSTY